MSNAISSNIWKGFLKIISGTILGLLYFIFIIFVPSLVGDFFHSEAVSMILIVVILLLTLILILIINSKKSGQSIDTKDHSTIEEEKNLAQIREEAIIKNEEKRKKLEKYSIKKIGNWLVIPGMSVFLLLVYVAIDYLTNKNINIYLGIPILAVGYLLVTASDINDRWKETLSYKMKIHESDQTYKWSNYEYENIYTDSRFDYFIYKTAKILSYLLSIIIAIIIGIILFLWLGSVTIPPTTIIIILLVIIIINQNKNNG